MSYINRKVKGSTISNLGSCHKRQKRNRVSLFVITDNKAIVPALLGIMHLAIFVKPSLFMESAAPGGQSYIGRQVTRYANN